MSRIEQGDLIKVNRASATFLVVSSDFFNSSGLVIVCPVVKNASEDALHVPVGSDSFEGIALCEQITTVAAAERGYSSNGRIRVNDLLEVIYRVQSMFDYYQHAE